MDTTEREIFTKDIHRALQNLYNPVELKQSPLIKAFQVEQRLDGPAAVRQILTSAIRSIKPDDKTPLESQTWRLYQVLTYRFSEQTPQKEVAAEMALSIRQLRRLENQAVAVLADLLWNKYQPKIAPEPVLGAKISETDSSAAAQPLQTAEDSTAPGADMPTSSQELEHLRESLPRNTASARELLGAAARTITPLIEKLNVEMKLELPEDELMVSGQMAALRQALIVLLTAAVNAAPGGRISIQLTDACEQTQIRVTAFPRLNQPAGRVNLDQDTLDLAVQLASMAGSSIQMDDSLEYGSVFSAALCLPVPHRVSVLAIDDNADVLLLLRRYLVGSRYQFQSAQDYQSAMALAETCRPQIIILDVMLPDVDGWEILGRLREHPLTRSIPVIVCTILPQEGLALALGAAGFIRKPVSRENLLKALDRLESPLEPGSN